MKFEVCFHSKHRQETPGRQGEGVGRIPYEREKVAHQEIDPQKMPFSR